jgi:hypothetical protein
MAAEPEARHAPGLVTGPSRGGQDIGWSIAILGLCCAALSSPGQSFAIGFYLEPLMDAAGVSRVAISTIYSGATLLAAVSLPFLGALADRTAAHHFLAAALALMAAAMALLAATHGVLVLAAAFFCLRLLGQGAISLGTVTLVARRYDRRLPRAFALTALGYAVGELLYPGVIVALFDAVGWRGSLLVFAALYLLVFAPAVYHFGTAGAGRRPRGGEREAADAIIRHAARPSHTLAAAARTPVFWALLAVVALPPLVMTAVLFHQVALFTAVGGGQAEAAMHMMAFALGGIAGTWPGAMLLERIPPRVGIAAGMTAMTVAFAFLHAAGAAAAAPLLYGGALGLAAGILKVAGTYIWPVYFGIAAVGAIKGTVNAVRNGATALGPPIAALIAGPAADFHRVLLPFAAAGAVAAAAVLLMGPPPPPAPQQPT